MLRFCFVVSVDGPESLLLSMACVNAGIVRQLHPDGNIVVVTDRQTVEFIRTGCPEILEIVDALVPVDVPTDLSNKAVSRYLKTTLRKHVEGDFLFLDVDAVPVERLDDLFLLECDFAAALDRNQTPRRYRMDVWVRELYASKNWPQPARYFNSGVTLVRCNERTLRFYEAWHECWNLTKGCGRVEDQPAFNRVLSTSSELRLVELPPRFNALTYLRPKSVRGAGIIHFLTGAWELRSNDTFVQLVNEFHNKRVVDKVLASKLIEHKCPWVDEWSPRLLWAMGRYLDAVWSCFHHRNVRAGFDALRTLGIRSVRVLRRVGKELSRKCWAWKVP